MVDLEQFDAEAAPKGRTDASDLPDGDYEFEIKAAKIKTTNQKKNILSMDVLVIKGAKEGMTVERPSFLVSKDSFNMCLNDLARLGFDAENWTLAKERPASKEIDKAVHWLTDRAKDAEDGKEGAPPNGLRFKGTKSQSGKFHNINIKERLEDGHPKSIGEVELPTVTLNRF